MLYVVMRMGACQQRGQRAIGQETRTVPVGQMCLADMSVHLFCE